jgi:hypothetical protein
MSIAANAIERNPSTKRLGGAGDPQAAEQPDGHAHQQEQR